MSESYYSQALKCEFEEGREAHEWVPSSTPWLSATGERYIELGGDGGEHGARRAFQSYAMDRPGAIYWRALPEIEIETGKFYMRLLISDKEKANV